MLEAVRRRGCPLVFGSSSSVYGDRAAVPFREDDPAVEPVSPYAATKRAGELLCRTYHELYGLTITCLRYFTVYGPRQRPDLAIHRFVRALETGSALTLYGDGSMERDFTYIDDIVAGTVRALERSGGFRLYNLGRRDPVPVAALVRMLEEITGRTARVEHRPVPPGDVRRTCADVSRAARELGYRPRTDLRTGLRRFVAWFRAEAQAGAASGASEAPAT